MTSVTQLPCQTPDGHRDLTYACAQDQRPALRSAT
jgi:hypothetical protein